MNTPFSQLEKCAAQQQPQAIDPYATPANSKAVFSRDPNMHRPHLNNPYTPVAQKEPEGWGWKDTALLGADLGLGSLPIVGAVWNGGRALWDAAHGDWGGAAMNAGLAGLGLVGLGGAGRAAATGAKVAANAGRLARLEGAAGKAIAGAAKGTGITGRMANGMMAASDAANAMKASGRALGKLPVTTGAVGYHAATQGLPVAASFVLPDGKPAPAPAQPTRQYYGSPADVMANVMTGGEPFQNPAGQAPAQNPRTTNFLGLPTNNPYLR
jgi:hypothetical protein